MRRPRWIQFRLSLAMTVSVLALALIGASAVQAAKPTRTVFSPDGFILPAGEACSFAVKLEPDEKPFVAITEFDDGRVQTIGHASPTLTNLDTGFSYVHRSRYMGIDTYDPVANDVHFTNSGRAFWWFLPGMVGPLGEVGENGAFFSIVGYVEGVWDLDAEVATSFTVAGKIVDLCVVLSG